ncbi:MAG: hypothetical protein IKX85_02220, partial [Clostridia bacterium]|nr:hypothetical protein [Clostridia bacterium]
MDLSAGKRIFQRLLKKPEAVPFTFRYDGALHRGFAGLKARRTLIPEENGVRAVTRARVDDRLRVVSDAFFNAEYGECEYTVWFENAGKKPTGVLSDVTALDAFFPGKDPVLRG